MSAIELKGGLFVATDAIAVALALEAKGVTLAAKDGVLTAAPASALTETDTASIRQWKRHLLAIAAYVPPEVEPCA